MQAAGLVLTAYQDSLSRAMDITANNVANMNTTGFKRENIAFDTYLVRPVPDQTYQFAVDAGTYRDTAPGTTLMTGNPLDVAVQGEGYIPIQTKGGIRYTRSGAFQLNNVGEIVTAAGDKVLGDGDQPLTLPEDATDILIGPDGIVSVKSGTGKDATQVGKLKLVKFASVQEMTLIGSNLYSSAQTPQIDTDSRFLQGSVEQSNVQPVHEMTRMIDISRSYQQVVHLLDLELQRETSAIQRLGRVTA
jgi:flagellar basal-body rod protein FlgF